MWVQWAQCGQMDSFLGLGPEHWRPLLEHADGVDVDDHASPAIGQGGRDGGEHLTQRRPRRSPDQEAEPISPAQPLERCRRGLAARRLRCGHG